MPCAKRNIFLSLATLYPRLGQKILANWPCGCGVKQYIFIKPDDICFCEIVNWRTIIYCRSWCPDRTLSQARKYVEESIGKKYAEGVILNLQETWEESDIRTPMICFLSMGSDPTNNIESLAKRLKLGKRLWSCCGACNDSLVDLHYLRSGGMPFLEYLHSSTQSNN